MKHISLFLASVIVLAIGCTPTFKETADLPDVPAIKEIIAGNASGMLPQFNAIYPDIYLDTVFIKDKTADFSNMYLRGNLEKGCNIQPLEESPVFGTYGDFSAPRKYRVAAPSGKTADWTVVMNYYIPPVGCLSDRWVGKVLCTDEIYPDYNPASCIGEKINNDCHRLKLTFDFWADPAAVIVVELQLGEINMDTFIGDLTLVKDVAFNSYGSDMIFHSGPAGTYNATANELHLDFVFSGYDIGGGNYKFTVRQSN